jgi:hypothetical protein
MKHTTVHTGILDVIQREPSSVNGNPRYLVRLDGYTAKTAVDSSEGYSITNYDGREVTADIGTHYGTTTIENVHILNTAKPEI